MKSLIARYHGNRALSWIIPLAAALLGALVLATTILSPSPAGASILDPLANQAATPAAPTGFSATAGQSRANLSWTNPNNSAIDYYEYQQKVGAGSYGAWAEIPNSHSGTTSARVTGLAAGVAHAFKIRARSSAGAGPASAEENRNPHRPVAKALRNRRQRTSNAQLGASPAPSQ